MKYELVHKKAKKMTLPLDLPNEDNYHHFESNDTNNTNDFEIQEEDTNENVNNQQNIEVHNIPLRVVNRPIPPVLDDNKVNEFKVALENGADFPPIDVMEIEHNNQNYYYSFGGCHRWAAHQLCSKDTIKARIIPTPKNVLNLYLGASNPFR